MSDNWICIIPKDPFFVPSVEFIAATKSILWELCPNSEEISAETDDKVQFRDCGGNFETVNCPNCGSEIPIETWQMFMDADYQEGGLNLNKYKMDCCINAYNINELTYYFNQGASRFIVSCMNPNRGDLDSSEIEKIQSAMGAPVAVIYQHI